MQKRSSKTGKKRDLNEIAAGIVEAATSDKPLEADGKNPAAVALGRLGGLKGGKARAKKLSKNRLSDIAKKAATARWSKQKGCK